MKFSPPQTLALVSLAALAACGIPDVSLFPIDPWPEKDAYLENQKTALTGYDRVEETKKYRIPVKDALAMVAKDADGLKPLVRLKTDFSEMTQVERGERHFNITYACAGCHGFNGQRKVGPHLNKRWGGEAPLEGGTVVAFNDEYFKESVLYSTKKIARGYPAAMPYFAELMSEEDYEDIKAYVMTYNQ
ncbi:MAG: cytochrome c [Myxococcota bacterium]